MLAILPLCSIRKTAQNIDKLASLPTHAKLFLDLVWTTLVRNSEYLVILCVFSIESTSKCVEYFINTLGSASIWLL